jgi:hypothetical protein
MEKASELELRWFEEKNRLVGMDHDGEFDLFMSLFSNWDHDVREIPGTSVIYHSFYRFDTPEIADLNLRGVVLDPPPSSKSPAITAKFLRDKERGPVLRVAMQTVNLENLLSIATFEKRIRTRAERAGEISPLDDLTDKERGIVSGLWQPLGKLALGLEMEEDRVVRHLSQAAWRMGLKHITDLAMSVTQGGLISISVPSGRTSKLTPAERQLTSLFLGSSDEEIVRQTPFTPVKLSAAWKSIGSKLQVDPEDRIRMAILAANDGVAHPHYISEE